MNHKLIFLPMILIFMVPLSLFSQDSENEGERLRLLAAEDLSLGNYIGALDKYKEAAQRLSGQAEQRCRLRILQIQWDLGLYENLPAEAQLLVAAGSTPGLVRGALIVEIKSLIRLGLENRALELMERYKRLLTEDPSTAIGLGDAYRDIGREDEAKRIEWIIKRDFPRSPEGLILTGRAERRIKPSLILP